MMYVALLRGINVGGNHLIRMTDLKACFEAQGMRDVATYIQSGNVIFTAAARPAEIARRLEAALVARFNCRTSVMLRSVKEMQAIVAKAPKGFGTEAAKHRYDVVFLNPPLTAAKAFAEVPTRPGVDHAHVGIGVLYFSRLISKAAQSRLPRVASMPIYKQMTIRNWNTTTKLLQMMTAGDSAS